MTWKGKKIEVETSGGGNSVSMSSGAERAEVSINQHKIFVYASQIVINGTAKPVSTFSRVRIVAARDSLTISVDDRQLFP
jgi:hypothetical protein